MEIRSRLTLLNFLHPYSCMCVVHQWWQLAYAEPAAALMHENDQTAWGRGRFLCFLFVWQVHRDSPFFSLNYFKDAKMATWAHTPCKANRGFHSVVTVEGVYTHSSAQPRLNGQIGIILFTQFNPAAEAPSDPGLLLHSATCSGRRCSEVSSVCCQHREREERGRNDGRTLWGETWIFCATYSSWSTCCCGHFDALTTTLDHPVCWKLLVEFRVFHRISINELHDLELKSPEKSMTKLTPPWIGPFYKWFKCSYWLGTSVFLFRSCPAQTFRRAWRNERESEILNVKWPKLSKLWQKSVFSCGIPGIAVGENTFLQTSKWFSPNREDSFAVGRIKKSFYTRWDWASQLSGSTDADRAAGIKGDPDDLELQGEPHPAPMFCLRFTGTSLSRHTWKPDINL